MTCLIFKLNSIFFLLLNTTVFAQNIWVQKSDLSGPGRLGAVGFSIGTCGYTLLGDSSGFDGYLSDFWKWDQTTDSWTQLSNFPGQPRRGAFFISDLTEKFNDINLSNLDKGNYLFQILECNMNRIYSSQTIIKL